MQDFTRQTNTQRPPRSPYNEPKKEKWLTKDRKWNLVFFIGSIIGAFFSTSLLASIIIMAIITRFFNKVTYDKKNDQLLNVEGKILNTKKNLAALPIPLVLTGWVCGGFVLTGQINIDTGFSAIKFGMFTTTIIYFIIKNIPISVLFNLYFWQPDLSGNYKAQKATGSITKDTPISSFSSSSDIYYNPGYSSLNSNIHNKHR